MKLEFQGLYRIAYFIEQRDGLPHRTPYSPGDDLSALPRDIRTKIEVEWTPEVIAAYREATKEVPQEPDPPPEPDPRDVKIADLERRLATVEAIVTPREGVSSTTEGER